MLFSPFFALPVLALSVSGLSAEEETIYAKVVKPILEARCVECHGPDKAKAKLRLDAPEHITAGDGIVVAGESIESLLIERIGLPEDDEDIMPPKGDPLTKEQIEAISWWIDEHQASYEATFVIAEAPDAVKKVVESGVAAAPAKPTEPELPEVDPADPALMKPLQDLGVLVLPLAQNTNLLHVESVSVAKNITDEHLALLEPLAPQLAWLYLNKTQITDEGLKHLAGLKQLRRLHLANTAITDAEVRHLEGLENLETLNIYGTKVTDAVLESVAKLPKLKKVFLYDTEVNPRTAFRFLNKHPELDVNLGWDFESLKNLDSGMAYHEVFDDGHQGSAEGGSVSYGDGPSGKAAKFDGKAFIVAGDHANFDKEDAFSVTAWVKGEPQDDGVIVARSDVADGNRGWNVHLTKEAIAFQLISDDSDNAIKVHAPVTMDKEAYYFVSASYDGSGKAEGVTLYLDGAPLETQVDHDNLSRTTKTYQVLHVGRRSDGAIFKGEIDDLRIYPSELSADQVGALFDRYEHKEAPGEAQAEQASAADDAGGAVALVALFDEGSCCHKAHAKEEVCKHPCCVEAADKGVVCLKCNPGVKDKIVKEAL